jgi:acetoin utilization deacetylase AcuC-like enzyme
MIRIFTDPLCLEHRSPPGYPERPERLSGVVAHLRERGWPFAGEEAGGGIGEQEAREAVLALHDERYVERFERAVARGDSLLDSADNPVSPGTWKAAWGAVSATLAAADWMAGGAAGDRRTAFAAVRPPGHHAERAVAMGFCFFNNAAIAARHARAVHGVERVAIMDFDVHHGNGTQAIFWNDPGVLYASTHEMPLYPGTGSVSEIGEAGTIVNAPLHSGDGSEAFRAAMETAVLPRIAAFAPDLIIISAGFDAHHRDPLGNINLDEADYAWATEKLMELAQKTAKGRIVSVLEGGYDLTALARSSAAHVRTLMGA